jgi:hypothetical protein
MKTLANLFEHTLKDVYYAENALTKALPKVSRAVKSADLKKAVDGHLKETKGQIQTLKKVFETIGVDPAGEKCDAIEGLIKESERLPGSRALRDRPLWLIARMGQGARQHASPQPSDRDSGSGKGRQQQAHQSGRFIPEQEVAAVGSLRRMRSGCGRCLSPVPRAIVGAASVRRRHVAECGVELVAAPFVDRPRHAAVELYADLVIRRLGIGHVAVPSPAHRNDHRYHGDQQYLDELLQGTTPQPQMGCGYISRAWPSIERDVSRAIPAKVRSGFAFGIA